MEIHVKKYIYSLAIITLLLSIVTTIFASSCFAKEFTTGSTTIKYFPPTESTINGIPESQIVKPMDVIIGPCFDSYSPTSYVEVAKFKQIAAYAHDNTKNSAPFNMSVTITRSESQGSEWAGNVNFTGEIKAGILGKIGITVGVEHKETRSTNEAVGVTGSMTVSPYKTGYIDFYYKGRSSGGTLRYYTYSTQDMVRHYFEVPVTVICYRAPYLDVYSESYQK